MNQATPGSGAPAPGRFPYIRIINLSALAIMAVYIGIIIYFLSFGAFDFSAFGGRVYPRDLDKPIAIVLVAFMLYLLTKPGKPILKLLMDIKRELPWRILAILALGIAIRLVYMSYTGYMDRSHDVEGHLQYIEFIANENALPARDECWQCYHPTLYYITAAVIYSAMRVIGPIDVHTGLQLWSLALYMIFLYYSVLIMKRHVPDGRFLTIAVSLLVFWPSGVMHSIRIGNDSLLYPLYSAGLYYLVKWSQEGKAKDLYASSALGVLAIFTKSNGVILIGVIGLTALLKFFTSQRKAVMARYIAINLVILMAGIGAAFYSPVKQSMDTDGKDWLVGNSDQLYREHERLIVGNRPENFIYFDLAGYLHNPFTDPWDDTMGRQYFWNFLLKTSLFTENKINLRLNEITASVMSLVLLFFILLTIFWVSLMKKETLKQNAVLGINALLLLCALVVLRIKIPAASSNDFRYILPVIISFVVFFVSAISEFKARGYVVVEWAAYLLVTLFVLSSVLFIVNPAVPFG